MHCLILVRSSDRAWFYLWPGLVMETMKHLKQATKGLMSVRDRFRVAWVLTTTRGMGLKLVVPIPDEVAMKMGLPPKEEMTTPIVDAEEEGVKSNVTIH